MPSTRKGRTYYTLDELSTRLDHQIDRFAEEIPDMIHTTSYHKKVRYV